MNCRINYYLTLLMTLIPSGVIAEEAFCYRNHFSDLKCEKTMNLIPEEYRSKAFFKEIKSTSPAHTNNQNYPVAVLPTNAPSRPALNQLDPRTSNYENFPSNLPSANSNTPRPLSAPNNLPSAQGHEFSLEEFPAKRLENESPLTGQRISKTNKQNGMPKIQIFVAKWCPHCRALENFLKSEKLTYTSFDVESDDLGREVFEQEGGGIPITKINGTTVIGFDEKKFKELVEAQSPY